MNEQKLPENDKDLQLARRIGKLLDDGQLAAESLSKSEFEQVLGAFKKAESANKLETTTANVSGKMWDAIASATQPTPKSARHTAKLFILRPAVYRFAVAASVLLAIVISWLVLQPASTPTLVAEAGNDMFVYQLVDGSSVSLRPHSALYETNAPSNNKRFILEGEAFFEVTSNPDRSFVVEAGAAQIAVLGTSFNVTNRDTVVAVYLAEGRIELTHLESQEQVVLIPGQVGTLSSTSQIELTESSEAPEHLDWLDDKIVFEKNAFIDIIRELEFHFSVTINIPAERQDETASGDLSLGSLEAALEKLSIIMGGGRFEQTGPTKYIFESDE